MPYRCKTCKRSFGKAAALRQHDRDVHRPKTRRLGPRPAKRVSFWRDEQVGEARPGYVFVDDSDYVPGLTIFIEAVFDSFMRAHVRVSEALSLSPPTIEGQIVNEDPT